MKDLIYKCSAYKELYESYKEVKQTLSKLDKQIVKLYKEIYPEIMSDFDDGYANIGGIEFKQTVRRKVVIKDKKAVIEALYGIDAIDEVSISMPLEAYEMLPDSVKCEIDESISIEEKPTRMTV
jgi:hypothetical protein